MPDVSGQGFFTMPQGNQQAYKYIHLGTAAGTTTITQVPSLLHAVVVNDRAASGAIVVYDSVGTSGTIIGSITFGTNTGLDPFGPWVYNAVTTNGLTVSNTANLDLTVLYLP